MTANVCGALFKGQLVTGTVTGNLYMWSGSSVSKTIPAHKGGICAVFVHKTKNQNLYSGGNDGLVKVWDESMRCINTVTLNNLGFSL